MGRRGHLASLLVETRVLQLEQHLEELVVFGALLSRDDGREGGSEGVRGAGGENCSLFVESLALVLADHVKETVRLCGIVLL